MKIARAILVTAFSAPAASLTGTVMDETGTYIPRAAMELNSGSKKYQIQADDAGVYKFSDLPPGEYTLKVKVLGFKSRTVKSIGLSEREPSRILDIPLDVGYLACGGPIILDRILLPPEDTFGRLSGSVAPPRSGVEVTLICRTFTACKSTKTDSKGRFTFDTLSAGVYGLNVRDQGFYPDNATGYAFSVNAGWESIYSAVRLERCRNGNCDPKLRPQRRISHCE